MEYIYVDEKGIKHNVNIHNFDRLDSDRVRIIGTIKLNPTDLNYPDKKWVNKNELLVKAEFTEDFIKLNTF